MALDDDLNGGFSNYYNPAFGLMAIQQPEAFVQHLASRGVQPPADFPDNFTHEDAHMRLAGMSGASDRAWRNLSPAQRKEAESIRSGTWQPKDEMQPGQPAPQPPTPPPTPNAPPEGTTRYNFQPLNGPGSSVTLPNRNLPPQTPSGLGRSLMPFAPEDIPNPDAPFALPAKPMAPEPSPAAPGQPPPDPNAPPPAPYTKAWESHPNELNPSGTEPTPPADTASTAGGAALPAGSSPTQPGGLNVEDPNATAAANPEDKKKAKKEDSMDSFGKALAGLSSMKPPQLQFPHPAQLPHPGNQISRSTVPQEILKEMSAIGHPTQMLRLGQALRGR